MTTKPFSIGARLETLLPRIKRPPPPYRPPAWTPGRRLRGEELQRRKAEIEARYQGTAEKVNNVQ